MFMQITKTLAIVSSITIGILGMVASPSAFAATEIQEVTSPGGITAWLVEEHSLPFVVIEAAWENGTLQDPEDKAGLTYMMAGLMNEGAGDLDSQAFQGELERLAANLSVRASRDRLSLSFKTLTENREEAVELLRLALTEPRFDQGPIEQIRGQLKVAILRDAESPDKIAADAWYNTALADHPYTRPSKGTVESIATLGQDDLIAHSERLFAKDNVNIAVVGDIGPDALKELLDDVFGDLSDATPMEEVALAEVNPEAQLQIIERNMPQSVVLFGHAGIAREDDDFIPAYVMNYILGGGGFSSRLMTEVREKRGLAYSVATYLYPLRHAALFIGQVATENERVSESLDVIRAEIAKLAAEGVTEKELADAKTYLTGSYPLRFDTNDKIAGQLIAIQEADLGIDYITRRNGLIEAVTQDDIKRVAKRLLGPENLIVTVVGQPEGLESD
ncbi:pitrilysin family protein [Parvibaculaceae bacterium PLY_AMNH_Bact1]|nr:pitrilysin family protein [Parvibaculaceae bacterium PLY_AMNH_Bact1]